MSLIVSRQKRWIFAVVLLLLFGLSLAMFYTTHVTVKMLPKDSKPEDTALPVTTNVVQQLAAQILTIPEMVAVQSYTGTASPFNFNGLVHHPDLRQ